MRLPSAVGKNTLITAGTRDGAKNVVEVPALRVFPSRLTPIGFAACLPR